jgi:hypothetical protein
MLETILGIVSAVGTVATTGNAVVELMDKIKKYLSKEDVEGMVSGQAGQPIHYASPPMTAFKPQMPNPYGHGNQWLPSLQALAQQHGNPWVPEATQPLLGINLTGIWVPPGNPYDQTFIRQYGPYLNVIAGVAGTPTVFAEGLFDPTHGVIHVVGRNMNGAPFEARGQLLPNWLLQGWMMTIGQFGQPVQAPYIMGKVA